MSILVEFQMSVNTAFRFSLPIIIKTETFWEEHRHTKILWIICA